MATQEDIDAVVAQIGEAAVDEGWNENKITELLDSGLTVDEVTLDYWEYKIARASTMVDVSENGSSRKLGDVFNNAMKMAEYYRKRTGDDDAEAAVRPVRTRGITRI